MDVLAPRLRLGSIGVVRPGAGELLGRAPGIGPFPLGEAGLADPAAVAVDGPDDDLPLPQVPGQRVGDLTDPQVEVRLPVRVQALLACDDLDGDRRGVADCALAGNA
ncbi:hypothetical protein ACI2L1_43885, partial [Streptomyces sp. NPDC019531]|uniref:hypothetical protein n=1 Tax=Streptomyces sp. NPDC019531 TaxID=3365062 RepID=UPI0038508ABA